MSEDKNNEAIIETRAMMREFSAEMKTHMNNTSAKLDMISSHVSNMAGYDTALSRLAEEIRQGKHDDPLTAIMELRKQYGCASPSNI